MSEYASLSRTGSPPEDALRQEQDDPGHFARQGDYDDPSASLVHDDAVAPAAGGTALRRDIRAPEGGAVRDMAYCTWRDAELTALDAAYAAWREEQQRALDASYLSWRDAPGETSFAQWRQAVSATRRVAPGPGPWPRPPIL